MMFTGANPMNMPELAEWTIKWNPFITIFLESVDRRTGSLLHLPFEGGTFEQPSKTMTILRVLQEEFLKSINKALKR